MTSTTHSKDKRIFRTFTLPRPLRRRVLLLSIIAVIAVCLLAFITNNQKHTITITSDLAPPSTNATHRQIHLLNQWYWPSRPHPPQSKLRISFTEHQGRLLASDAFAYASHLKPHIAILANQDIYFDASLSLIHTQHADLSPYVTAFIIGTQCGPKFVGSHDAIVFIAPLPEPLIAKFERFGILGRNPCEDIKIWHVHWAGVKDTEATGDDAGQTAEKLVKVKKSKGGESRKRTRKSKKGQEGKPRVMPEVNVDGKSSIAFPSLKTKFKKVVDELWGQGIKQ
ncbi:hypothetical protein BC829DRAFT_392945 [Chytridium lagenaria]|nr:hypothetical protein BC829DRAFT_392945 [Chytridium lagenaria]